MSEKPEVLRARVSIAAKASFVAVASEHGLSPSDFLRLMIDQVTDGVVAASGATAEPAARREATVTIDEEVKLVSENQSVYIPLGATHRLENPGKVDLHLIEVQTGAYLGEDDIIRYEDVYNRT